jgi:pilus assembly protein CpaE
MNLPLIGDRKITTQPFLAALSDPLSRDAARGAAAELGWPADGIRDGGVREARQALAEAPASGVLLVDLSEATDPVAEMHLLAEVCEPGVRVLAVGEANDVALYRALLRMGVSDYLVKPLEAASLAEALRRADRAAPAPAQPAAASARLVSVAVIGARGGVGATSVAVSLAWDLAHTKRVPTVLADLDLQFGSAALSLDLEPGRGLKEILVNPERIDALLIGSAMVAQGETLKVLCAEEPLDEEIAMGGSALTALKSALAGACDVLVFDLPRRLDPLARKALAEADLALVVTDLSLSGARDAQRLLNAVRGLRPDGQAILIGNRTGGVPGELPQAEFERAVGSRLDHVLPHDAKDAQDAAETAKPLFAGRRTPAGVEIGRLADRLTGEAAQPPPERTAWLQRLLRR